MSSSEPYQRAPIDVIDTARYLLGLKTPPSKLSTRRAIKLLDVYSRVSAGLSRSDHPYDHDMLHDLQEKMGSLPSIVDRRLTKEQYGRIDSV